MLSKDKSAGTSALPQRHSIRNSEWSDLARGKRDSLAVQLRFSVDGSIAHVDVYLLVVPNLPPSISTQPKAKLDAPGNNT
jgi:hypothetical protein